MVVFLKNKTLFYALSQGLYVGFYHNRHASSVTLRQMNWPKPPNGLLEFCHHYISSLVLWIKIIQTPNDSSSPCIHQVQSCVFLRPLWDTLLRQKDSVACNLQAEDQFNPPWSPFPCFQSQTGCDFRKSNANQTWLGTAGHWHPDAFILTKQQVWDCPFPQGLEQ